MITIDGFKFWPSNRRWHTAGAVAGWFYRKAQENARQAGTYQAARNLRKQGVPLEYALAILAGRLA